MLSTTLLRFATLLTLVAQVPTPNAASPSPGPRTGAYMVYDAARQEIVLFGGWTQEKTGSDIVYPDALWAWDGQRWRRRDPPPGTPRPVGRDVPVLAYDAARQRVVMFGGRRDSTPDPSSS